MGAGGIKSLAAAKAPMSMGEILEVLLSKARVEAEDAQRVLLGALNGLAALMLLEPGPHQTPMAVQTYRQVAVAPLQTTSCHTAACHSDDACSWCCTFRLMADVAYVWSEWLSCPHAQGLGLRWLQCMWHPNHAQCVQGAAAMHVCLCFYLATMC